jgi:hypothetical protein
VAAREGHARERCERAHRGARSVDDLLREAVREPHAEHRDREEENHATRARAQHFERSDHCGDHDHEGRAAEIREASQDASAHVGRVRRRPTGNAQVGPNDVSLPAHLEGEHRHADEQRERDREREPCGTRGADAFTEKGRDAAMRRELVLDRAGRGVHRAVRRVLRVSIRHEEDAGRQRGRDESGDDEHHEYSHWSSGASGAPPFFPRGRLGNRGGLG